MFIENEFILRALNELDTNALFIVDKEGFIRNINKGVTKLLGYREHDIIGKKVEFMLSHDVKKMHKSLFSNYVSCRKEETQYKSKIIGIQRNFPDTVAIQDNEPKRFSVIHKDKQEIPVTLTINEVLSDSDELAGFVVIILNNTEQYNLQKKLEHQSSYDELTGLISWHEFFRRINQVKKSLLEKGTEYHASILYLDIDYFKTITYESQSTADSALMKVSTWLLNNTRQKGERDFDLIVSHFIGDEFILYLPRTPSDGALTLANRLKSEFLKLNLRTSKRPYFSSLSIGVATIGPHTKLQDAISQASSACRIAKEKGKDKIKVAQEEDTQYLKLDHVIREALRNQRLKLYAQKIVAISPCAKSIDNNRAHYEILSRMEDEQGNIISPVAFIPAAEKLGLAIAIDMYVVEHTLSLLQNNPGHVESLSLCSINLSGLSASNERMLYFIENKIRKSEIDPRKLCFEVTETYQIQDNDIALELVSRLKKIGCKFAFDDFGIGHSNYQSFSRLPVDIVKIDGSYVRHVLENKPLRADVEGMINSAKSRGLEVVAEYAENKEIVTEMERMGVDYAQGYYFAKPVPWEALK